MVTKILSVFTIVIMNLLYSRRFQAIDFWVFILRRLHQRVTAVKSGAWSAVRRHWACPVLWHGAGHSTWQLHTSTTHQSSHLHLGTTPTADGTKCSLGSWKRHVISQDLPGMHSSTASKSPLPGKARWLLVSHYRLMPRQHQRTVVKATSTAAAKPRSRHMTDCQRLCVSLREEDRLHSHINFYCTATQHQPLRRRRASGRPVTSDRRQGDANTSEVTSQAVRSRPGTNLAYSALKHCPGPGRHRHLQCVIRTSGVSM